MITAFLIGIIGGLLAVVAAVTYLLRVMAKHGPTLCGYFAKGIAMHEPDAFVIIRFQSGAFAHVTVDELQQALSDPASWRHADGQMIDPGQVKR